MKVIIAAAGTGGHINPGIAIANKIKEKQPNSEIIFIGTNRGLENDLVPRAGFELKKINAYGLSKKISIENMKRLLKTFKGLGEANKIIKEFKPDIVIGTGGYICGAVVLAAKRNNIPVVLHESNAFPGKAVQMLAKNVNTILVSFKDAQKRIKKCKNVVYTGTPVKLKKQDYNDNQKAEIINSLGLSQTKPIVLIFGGSQGAQKINEAIINILKNKLNTQYQILWATGPKQYEIIKDELKKDNINIEIIENTKIVPYIYNMEEAQNVCDLVVARSGAMTVTEIANLAKPSILIPLPSAGNNRQIDNAKVLERIGAAIIITNDALSGEILNNNINNIVLDKDTCKRMGSNAFKVSTKDVEEKIYNEVKKLVQGDRK